MNLLEKIYKSNANYASVALYSLYVWKEIEAYYHESGICGRNKSTLTQFERFVIEGMEKLKERAEFYERQNQKGL